ncbi:hypothetical protein JCM24511_06474 [Saitozyma sp. JCM 24511]|nr:hypothetical protein JCM24511_06474 [Saitozyma sp. JCM 24511]
MATTTSNPSHLLISRNPPRSPAHPQLAPTSTSRHAPNSPFPLPTLSSSWTDDPVPGPSRTRSSSAPLPNGDDAGPHSTNPLEGEDEEDERVEIHPTFSRYADMPGRVKVIVGREEFWCHKEILWFASPFFKALLEGSWAETNHAPLESASPSRRDSVLSTASPTDTDTDTGVGPCTGDGSVIDNRAGRIIVSPSPAHSLGPGNQPCSAPMMPSSSDGWQSALGDSDDAGSSHKASVYLDANDGPSVAEIMRELRELPEPGSASGTSGASPSRQATPSNIPHSPANPDPTPALGEVSISSPRNSAFSTLPTSLPALLQPQSSQPLPPAITTSPPSTLPSRLVRRQERSPIRHSFSSFVRPPSITRPPARGRDGANVEAVVELHEESASAFQDFLFWAYPHLECKVTWGNVENLLALAAKLLVPPLQKLCEHFLMTHASGKPVMALALAEQHVNPELFREASRFVLDQPTWNPDEFETLSDQTQLKLSQKRTWFLERLLKLGSIDVRKEYTCRSDCPDPTRCQAQLDDKWRQAHVAVSRYGPPQPSVAFRCLSQLETFPTNPSLVMPNLLCQETAKTWVMLREDRARAAQIMAAET